MNRNTAIANWTKVSNWKPCSGEITIDNDLVCFLQEVAASLLQADDETNKNKRFSAIVKASGFSGRRNSEFDERTEKHLQIHYDFSPLDDSGKNLPYSDAERFRATVEFMRVIYPSYRNIDDDTLVKRVRRKKPKMHIPK